MTLLNINRRSLYVDILECVRVLFKMLLTVITLVITFYSILTYRNSLILIACIIPIIILVVDTKLGIYIDRYMTIELQYDMEKSTWVFSYVRIKEEVTYSIRVEDVIKYTRHIDGVTLYGTFYKTEYDITKQVTKVYIPDLVDDFDDFYLDIKDATKENIK